MSDYKTTIRHAGDEFFVGTTPHNNSIIVDTKGDRHSAPTPLELLLIAVGSCTAVDVVSILEKKRQKVSDYKVEVTGTRREEHPRGFTSLHINHIVYGRGVSPEAVAAAIKLSDEKYCSVAETLRPGTSISTSYEIVEVE